MDNITLNANWFKAVDAVHNKISGSVLLANDYTEIWGAIFAVHLDIAGES